jgi:UDP-3-O-[3-hydroxymyristoyl] glucosamine N-acyltransferase
MRLSEIARLVDGEVAGDGGIAITGVAKIEDAQPGDITFLANLKYKKYVTTTSATAIFVLPDFALGEFSARRSLHFIKVADPYTAFLQMVDQFHPPSPPPAPGIHPTAIIAKTATIGSGTSVGAHVVVGEQSVIGSGVILHAGTVISDRVHVGDHTIIYPNVTIYEGCKIGKHVIIHASTTIGGDGFGFSHNADGTYEKIPQRGIVVIEDDVEIGANCTIDRATLGETLIKRGAKLDNLIQVAHNVVIGEHTVIAAQTGISGSTHVGSNCAIGGQVGLSGHLRIADRTTLGAKSGIPKSITEPGQVHFGYPAFEIHETLKIQAATRQLPGLLVEVRNLQKRIEELEQLLQARASESK